MNIPASRFIHNKHLARLAQSPRKTEKLLLSVREHILRHILVQPSLQLNVRPEVDCMQCVDDDTVCDVSLGIRVQSYGAMEEEGLLWNGVQLRSNLRSWDL